MDIFQAMVLGLVQGATEFIPVSSSAHLVLVPWLLKWSGPGLAFDTILHLGTLLAMLAVFWRDFISLAIAWWRNIVKSVFVRYSVRDEEAQHEPGILRARLTWWIILGTIPAALMGALWEEQFEALFHSPIHVSVLLLVTGLWLVLAERFGGKSYQAEDMRWWQALLVGLAQGGAIAPGISRSGATIGAGLLLGLRREAATRFSFLLATPIIFGAGMLQVKRLLESPDLQVGLLPLALGFLGAFLSGYACIRFLLDYVKKRSLLVFAVYCWLLGFSTMAIYLLR
nr:undecaprenyl-diphosphatase UppP [Chloroflexota bacterium]